MVNPGPVSVRPYKEVCCMRLYEGESFMPRPLGGTMTVNAVNASLW